MSEGLETTTDESTATDTGGEEASTPDIGEQLAALNQRLDTHFPEQEAEAEPDAYDLYDLLSAEEDEGEYEEAEDQPEYDPEEAGPDENEAMELLHQIVNEQVSSAINPTIEAIEQRERHRELGELTEQYPQLAQPDVQQAIRNRLAPLAEQYGNRALLTDSQLVETALLAHLASERAAGETPADQARGQGASLETGVGAANTQTEDDYEDTFKRALLSGNNGGAFG